jgi:hypothetical protein
MIALSDTVSISADLLSTEIDGEIVMMDMEAGRYLYLDRIGSVIWTELAQPRTVADLCQSLAGRYAAPLEEIERDVLDLLEQMQRNDLIRLHD